MLIGSVIGSGIGPTGSGIGSTGSVIGSIGSGTDAVIDFGSSQSVVLFFYAGGTSCEVQRHSVRPCTTKT